MKDAVQAAIILAVIITVCAAQSISGDAVSLFGPGSNGQRVANSTNLPGGSDVVNTAGRTQTVGSAGMATDAGIDADVANTPPANTPPDAGEEGAVRLVSRVDANGFVTGTLQVFLEGAWGAVCGSNFDDRDAMVACRQLGYSGGVARENPSGFVRPSPASPDMIAPFALENLGCSGNELQLVDCPAFDPRQARIDTTSAATIFADDRLDYQQDFISASACDPFRLSFARIACGTDESTREGSIRLAKGAVAADGSAEYGRLEVLYRGGWGTVCSSAFTPSSFQPIFSTGSETVACRQLGFEEGSQIQPLESSISEITQRVPIVLPGLKCNGSERSLRVCPDFDLGLDTGTCGHSNDVHLLCFSSSNPDLDGATRLVGGEENPMQRYAYGRLEVFSRGFWSKVCTADRFPPNSAQVACRALGYDGGAALRFTESYANRLKRVLFKDVPVALSAVDCDGSENSISECTSGNPGGKCAGERSSTILACSFTAPGCNKQEGSTEGAVRLRGGFGTLCDPVHSGFIEILHKGEWGSICTTRQAESSLEDLLVADVACRQLGFPQGTRVNPLTAAGQSPEDSTELTEAAEPLVERYWLSSVACAGPESRLVDCDLGKGFRQNNAGCIMDTHRIHIACRKFPVVEASEAVTTEGADEGDLRLVDDAEVDNWVTGRLQMFFEGSWSRVCPYQFNVRDITVACRQLGFGEGTKPLVVLGEVLDDTVDVPPELAIIGASCNGTEERLIDCETTPPRVRRAEYDDSLDYDLPGCSDVLIACVNAPLEGTEGDFRLANKIAGASDGAESGFLEVFHAGAWGTICDVIRDQTAKVACLGFGFVDGFFSDSDSSAVARPPWLSGIRCRGNETNVADCVRFAFGDIRPCERGVNRLFCFNEVNRQQNGQVRLTEGRADPRGTWQYGRMEVLINGVWSIVNADRIARESISLSRAEVLLACQTLGFNTGGRMLVGDSSPYPAPLSAPDLISEIFCGPTAEAFNDCEFKIDGEPSDSEFYDPFLKTSAVALVCANPSGCTVQEMDPTEGDVRLVPFAGESTSICDEVHLGEVQLFRKGRWGRVCFKISRFGDETLGEFGLDAQVICRQLGFPFGTVMDYTQLLVAQEGVPIWASQVVCTGRESSLLDCVFPERFGRDNDRGIAGSCQALYVICRQFEIIESAGIRR